MKSNNRYPNDHNLRKPHLYWFGGYWRVTKFPGLNHRNKGALLLWQKAHDVVAKWNTRPKLKAKQCGHHATTFDPLGWPTGEDLEVCSACGMSRTHWEQGESAWVWVADLDAARLEIQKALDSL